MIVAAARELAGQRVCFVGVGLPNIAVNLAQRTVAPDLELVYEAGVFGARPARLPLSIGDPTIVTGATAAVSMFELFAFYLQGGLIDVGFLGAAQIDRFGNINTTVIGDYATPDDAPAGLRRRLRDRDQRPPDLRDHAPVAALVRGPDRLPDVARQPRRGRGTPSGSGASRAGSAAGRRSWSPTSASTTSTTTGEMRLDSLHPGRHARSRSARRSAGSPRSAPTWARPRPPTGRRARADPRRARSRRAYIR